MPKTETAKVHEVVFRCRGVVEGKMRNALAVKMEKPWAENYELATDEGKYLGGEGTAPPPLALFVASLVGCVMTQIRSSAKRLAIPLKDLAVEAVVEWEAHQTGNDPYEATPKGFCLDIDVDCDAPLADVKELIGVARKSCFIEQTLVRTNVIRHRLRSVDGGWVDI